MYQQDLFNIQHITQKNKPVEKTAHYKEKFVFCDKDEIDLIFEDTDSTTKGKMQSEFPEDYLKDSLAFEKQKEEQRKKEHHQKVLEARKQIKLKDYPEPKNDNEKLMHLQYLFLKSNKQEDWWNLMTFAEVITKRLVWYFMKEKRIPLDEISQNEKVGIALVYVMRRYEETIGYYVSKNYISFLKGGVKHAFEYFNKSDKELLLGDIDVKRNK